MNSDINEYEDYSENDGKTILIEHASNNDLETLKALVNAGSDIEAPDRFGDTCLHHALANGGLQVSSFLIKESNNILVENNKGETPLDVALIYAADEDNVTNYSSVIQEMEERLESLSQTSPRR